MRYNNLPPNLPRLKAGWSWVKLGDVVDNFKRGPFGSAIKKSFFVPNGYKVYEQKNAIYNSIELGNYFIDEQKFIELQGFEVGPGDFIVSCSGTIGKIYRLPPNASKGVINQALLRIRLKEKKIFEKYFLELFKSYWFQKKMLVETRGSAMLNIAGVKELKQIPIPLPPLSEQKKIVEKIEELFSGLDSGVASLKKAKEQIKLYRQSVLASAFNGKLIGDGNIDEKTGLPQGWANIKLGDLVRGTQGVQIPKDQQITQPKPNYKRYLYISDFKNDKKLKFVKDNYPTKEVNVKDLIMVNTGATAGQVLTGKSGILSNNLFKITYPEEITREFLLWYLRSPLFYGKMSVELKGAANEHMGHEKFYNYFIPLPSLHNQKKLVEEIESRFAGSEALEKVIDESLKKSEALRQSILKKAFEGKLC